MFFLLDRDRDGVITKEGILDFLDFERENNKVFPSNVMRAVELYEDPKSGQIDGEEFHKMSKQIKFLVFPAHRLQDSLKSELLGFSFWEEISLELEEKKIATKIEKKKARTSIFNDLIANGREADR